MMSAFPDARCEEIVTFWFGAARERPDDLEALRARTKMWFFRDGALDAAIRERFLGDVERASSGALDAWKGSPLGALGLVVLLDQFPRNLHRDSARAFATDARAVAIALAQIDAGLEGLTPAERFVFYLPLMHTEDAAVQARCCALFARLHDEAPASVQSELANGCKAAERHRYIVERFGRFPHRNALLGRESTAEEAAFLKEPNSSF
jgi:uncharacterized protein (DUF924 family)